MIRLISRLLTAVVLVAGSLTLLFAAPSAPVPTLDSLQSLVEEERFDEALAQSEQYLKAHPGNRDARFLRAVALAGEGETDAAIAAFQALAEDYPQRPEPANNLAALYAGSGQYDKAQQWLETAMGTQPAYATAHQNLGHIYTALATKAYSQVLDTGDSPDEKGIQLKLVDQLYYSREAGVPVGDSQGDGSNDMQIIRAPEPTPEDARPPEPEQAEPPADPSPVPPLDPAARHNLGVIQTVRAWALAWSRQEFDAYIDFYADTFSPGNDMSRTEWRQLRRARIASPESIHIRIEQPRVDLIADDRARVTFVQGYESPTYSDQVKKRLLMQRTRAGWRILQETDSPY